MVVVVLVLAVLVGKVAGGGMRGLTTINLGRVWLVWIAFAVQFVLAFLPADLRGPLRVPLLSLAFAAVVWWMATVWDGLGAALRVALMLVAMGWVMNLTVITLNSGMPVSAETLERVGLPSDDIESGDLSKHVTLDDDTVLPWLGDVIPLPLIGPLRKAVSLGDVVMLVGLLLFVPAAMRRDPDPDPDPESDPNHAAAA